MKKLVLPILVAGCNSLLGIPSGGEVVGDGSPGDVSTIGNCQDTPDDCRLAAFDREIGREGEALILEGTFGDEVSVEFPGSDAPVAAQLLGAHRARVTIPTNATNGPVFVNTVGKRFASRFRATTFKLGFNHFQLDYAQANEARAAPVLAVDRTGASAITVGGNVLVIGGQRTAGDLLDTVELAEINSDSTLGAFKLQITTKLATARASHTVTRIGNLVVVIGGRAMDGTLASVEVAPIDQMGNVGMFMPGPSLTGARAGHTAVVIGPSLFVFGGGSGDTGALKTVERALFNPDGTLGPFEIVAGLELPDGRVDQAAAVVGDQLYLLGGAPGPNMQAVDTVLRAQINGDGTLQPFEVAGTLDSRRAQATALVVGNRLVMIGGFGSPGTALASVESAPLVNNQVGVFEAAKAHLAVPRGGAATAIGGNYLHVIGGLSAGVTLKSVEHTSLIGDGDLEDFGLFEFGDGKVTATARTRYSASVVGSVLAVIGGFEGVTTTNQVSLIQLGPDGSPAMRFLDTPGTQTPSADHRTAVIRDFLYVFGGTTSSGATEQDFQAMINPIAGFAGTKSMTSARASFTASILGPTMYMVGSEGILANESVNPDANTGDLALPFVANANSLVKDRAHHCSAVIGTFLYVIGGVVDNLADPPVVSGTIERAPLQANVLRDFAPFTPASISPRGRVSCAVIGRYLYVIGGGTVAIERAPIDPDTFALGAFESVSSRLTTSRQEHRVIELGNAMYVVGGDAAGIPINSMERATIR